MKLIFWLCLFLIAYTYTIYPLLVIILARLVPDFEISLQDQEPEVVMIIAAYNEETILEEKIENCLALDYPPEKIRFLFGSDGSSDATNKILTSQENPRIKSLIFPEREGKSSVLNKMIPSIQEEIVLFSDANTLYKPDSVRRLMGYFTDPLVGGVCGRLVLINQSGQPGGEGEGLYWRFENLIKEAEGAIHSVISANGAIFAVRRELIDPLPIRKIVNDDFSITLSVLRKHRKVIYDPKAIAEEQTSPDMEGEFVRKVRISSLNFNSLPEILPLLSPRYGLTALGLFSHKILRWIVPMLGFGMLVSNLILFSQGGIYPYLLIGQGIVYLGALLGFLGDRFWGSSGPFIPFYYLAMINIALVIGFWRSLTRTQKSAWERVQR